MLLRHISGVEKVVNKAEGLRADCQLNLLYYMLFDQMYAPNFTDMP